MVSRISFREIPIFQHLEPTMHAPLAAIFQTGSHKLGSTLLNAGQSVPGIYIVVEGELTVSAPNFQLPLATLGRGQCIGEMSLVEEGSLASATVSVSSPEAVLVFCAVQDFRNFLDKTAGAAFAFYRGAAQLLSARLRHTDAILNQQIEIGANLIVKIINSSKVNVRLATTRSEVNVTGEKVISQIMKVLPTLDEIQKRSPETADLVSGLRTALEEIFLIDAQNFDRLSQQLDLIIQHFDNLKRVANGGTPVPLRGDMGLFDSGHPK